MATREPSETSDIFIHQEGDDWIAYHGGQEISKKTRLSQERFYADLHVWIRKHKYEGPIWRVKSDGNVEEDRETAEKAAAAYQEHAG